MTSIDPTPEMLAFYERRTNEHIERVCRCLMLLAAATDYSDELTARARVHDASKFGPEERIPYVWLTEYHRRRRRSEPFEYPPGVAEQVKLAIQHHVTTNRHHPEFHSDPNEMSDVDLIEMVCDWTAMAQEFDQDGGSARGWAEKTIGQRVPFNAERRQFIYHMIEELDRQIAANAGLKNCVDLPVFGAAPLDVVCRRRLAAYAVIADADGRVAAIRAIVRERTSYWLPGGRIEHGETPQQAVVREVHEELGRSVRLLGKPAEAIQYLWAGDDDCWYEMRASFIRATFDGEPDGTGEYDLHWLDARQQADLFFHACHAWAASQA
jgi:8-oxo-dGTP pyrophosphatase MutT (NUDIX family)